MSGDRHRSRSPLTTSSQNDVFNCLKASNSKKSIEIKIPESLSVRKGDTEAKPSLYGRWEAYQPEDTDKRDLSKLTKLCQTISAREGVVEEKKEGQDVDSNGNVHHPFNVRPAPMYTPTQYTHRHTPTVSSHIM